MRAPIFPPLFLLLTTACATVDVGRFEDRRADVERIVAESLVRGRAWDKLEELCTVAPHRLSGSSGAEDAVEWGYRAMVDDGLQNVRLEPCTVPHWERGEVGELVGVEPAELAGQDLPLLALGGSVATPPEGIEAEVVCVRDFEELAALGEAAAGKIVLFCRPMDDASSDPFRAYGGAVGQRSRGAIEAARVGAVAALVRSMTTLRDDVPHTGGMRYEEGVPRIPGAAVSTNAADRIVELVEAGERVVLRLRMDCRWYEDKPSFNVVGELVGSDLPDEVVVLGAHLDSWDVGQGAHDCGGGCVQVIEALRLLKDLGLRPRRTLRAVLFMNEENGLAGGRAYYEQHLADMEKHVMALESDRGAFAPRGFTTDAGKEAFGVLTEAALLLRGFGGDRVVAGYGGADISPMKASGVVQVGYLPDPQRYFDVHHSAADTLDEVNRRELQLGAAVIAALCWIVADAPDTLPRNPLP